MHAEYKRDVSHNYLILHGEESINTASYQVRMLTGNTMSSILKCRMQGLDGKWLFYYDITSKQSVASFYEQRKFRGEDLEMIFGSFVRAMEELAEYLLSTDQLLLCPEYMFLDVEKKKISFCCLPDYHHPVQEQFRELTEYFLPKLDHEDQKAVNLGYGIYRKAMETGLQLEHIKELLYRTGGNKEYDVNSDTGTEVPSEENVREAEVSEEQQTRAVFDISDRKVSETGDEAEPEKEKTNIRWKFAAGCTAGVISLIGILAACYLGYLPGVPAEAVIGAAIVLMGVGVGLSWTADKKKQKEAQSAEWRSKVQRELAGTNTVEQPAENIVQNEKQTRERQEVKMTAVLPSDQGTPKMTGKEHEEYGETVVLSAGALSGPASLVSREPGELAPIYLEQELTVIGKLEQAADAVITLPTVSRVHARIRKEGDDYYLADLNSRNGTSVNGRMLGAGEEYLLQDEDQVDFAQARYIFLK